MVLSQPNKKFEDFNPDEDAKLLQDLLSRVLDRLIGIYEQRGVPLPARRYWMLGPEVPEDCAQAVVTFAQSYLGLPGDGASAPQSCGGPRSAVLNVVITRDYPIGKFGKEVPAADIIEASKWAAADVSILMWALNDLAAIEGMPGPQVIATVNVNPPNGAVQSTILNITMALM